MVRSGLKVEYALKYARNHQKTIYVRIMIPRASTSQTCATVVGTVAVMLFVWPGTCTEVYVGVCVCVRKVFPHNFPFSLIRQFFVSFNAYTH